MIFTNRLVALILVCYFEITVGNEVDKDIKEHMDKWVKLQNVTGYYYFGSSALNWIESFKFCAEKKAKLVSIETDEENTALFKYIEYKLKSKHQWWTSGSSRFTMGKEWTWMSTGNGLSYTAWCRGEPNNQRHSDYCLILRLPVQCWNDIRCNLRRGHHDTYHPICEKPDEKSLGPLSIVHGPLMTEGGTPVWSPCVWFIRYVKRDPQWQVRCMSPNDVQ